MQASVQDQHGSQGRKNHRVVVTRHGGPEVLRVVADDLPEPGPGEVRVRVMAAGVSAYDLMHRRPSTTTNSCPHSEPRRLITARRTLWCGSTVLPAAG